MSNRGGIGTVLLRTAIPHINIWLMMTAPHVGGDSDDPQTQPELSCQSKKVLSFCIPYEEEDPFRYYGEPA